MDSLIEPRPVRLRDRFRAATKEAIVKAAERTFAEDGVKAARMDTIAQAAGVAVGTLYNHFEDRRALVRALMKTRQAELLRHLDEELEAHQRQTFLEQLCVFVDTIQEFFVEHESFLQVLLETEHLPAEEVGAPPSALFDEIRKRLEVLVLRGVRSKALRADGSGLFGWVIVGALRALLVRQARGEGKEPIEAQRALLVRFVLQGTEAKRGSAS